MQNLHNWPLFWKYFKAFSLIFEYACAEGMPSFQQTPVAYSSLLAAVEKEQLGSCKKCFFFPPRCPTFPFYVILCKEAQPPYFCARHLWHYCTSYNPHICGISGSLGPMWRSMGHCWSLGLGWVVWSYFTAPPRAETFLWLSARTEGYPKQVLKVRAGSLTQRSGSCSSRYRKY